MSSAVLSSLVAAINGSSLETLYIYTGPPVYYDDIPPFIELAQRIGLRCRIVKVGDEDFSPSAWNLKTSILYIPGAPSSKLDLHLGAKIGEIRRFIEAGGAGIFCCGGGYWACRHTVYQGNEPKRRELALWKGTGAGPLLPMKPTEGAGNVDFFHGAVPLHWAGSKQLQQLLPEGLELKALLSGGGYFIPAEDEHPYRTLATYTNEPDERSRASVLTSVGQGKVLFLNPYFTYGPTYLKAQLAAYKRLFPAHDWDQILRDLTDSELQCQICFADHILEAAQNSAV